MNDSLVIQPSEKRTRLSSRKFTVESWSYDDPDLGAFERDVVVHPGAVLIIGLVDPDHVAMVHNARHAVGRELLELPAGTLEPGEPPDECARRELREETGFSAARIEPLSTFYTCPGICTELMHAFVARDLRAGAQQLEPTEQIRCQTIPLSTALTMCTDGRIIDGKTIAALTMFHMRETV